MRKQMKRISRSEEEADINLTPMLDVVFIMLIFFIVTATFIKQAGIDVLRPEALTGEQKPTVALLVAISPGGDIWIDKNEWIRTLFGRISNACMLKTLRGACCASRPNVDQ